MCIYSTCAYFFVCECLLCVCVCALFVLTDPCYINMLSLKVQAVDPSNEKHNDVAQVVIYITDINDHAPIFDRGIHLSKLYVCLCPSIHPSIHPPIFLYLLLLICLSLFICIFLFYLTMYQKHY